MCRSRFQYLLMIFAIMVYRKIGSFLQYKVAWLHPPTPWKLYWRLNTKLRIKKVYIVFYAYKRTFVTKWAMESVWELSRTACSVAKSCDPSGFVSVFRHSGYWNPVDGYKGTVVILSDSQAPLRVFIKWRHPPGWWTSAEMR